MYFEYGCWFHSNGSLYIGGNYYLKPFSTLCVIFEDAAIHHVHRIIICQENLHVLAISQYGEVDVKKRNDITRLYIRQHHYLTLFYAWHHKFDAIDRTKETMLMTSYRWEQRKRSKQRNSNNIQQGQQDIGDIVVDDNTSNTVSIGFASLSSSVVPLGKVKCRCHMYHDVPWNGSCTICGVRNHTMQVPKYIENFEDQDCEDEDSIFIDSEYEYDSFDDDDVKYDDRGRLRSRRTDNQSWKKRQNPNTKKSNFSKAYQIARDSYKKAVRTREVDPVGIVRPHHQYELDYFNVARQELYGATGVQKKEGEDTWKHPKNAWYANIKRKERYPQVDLVQSLIEFSQKHFHSSLRHGWEDKLKDLPIYSDTRFCYALLLCISAQGMGDRGVVPHINGIIATYGDSIVLSSLVDPQYVGTLLRRTSKWVKNSIRVAKIAQYILLRKKGVIPTDFSFFTGLKGISQKTAALLFWAWREETVCLPVDLHVAYSFKRFGWTHVKASREEIAFQAKEWLPSSLNILMNDAIGAIGQQLPDRRSIERCNQPKALDAYCTMLEKAAEWKDTRIKDLLAML